MTQISTHSHSSNGPNTHIANAWQARANASTMQIINTHGAEELKVSSSKESELSTEVLNFIESLRNSETKKETFKLLSQKLNKLHGNKKTEFLTKLGEMLKDSTNEADKVLYKQKIAPSYALYIAAGMSLEQINRSIYSDLGKSNFEDDDDDDC